MGQEPGRQLARIPRGLLLGSMEGLGDTTTYLLSLVQGPGSESGMGKKKPSKSLTVFWLEHRSGLFVCFFSYQHLTIVRFLYDFMWKPAFLLLLKNAKVWTCWLTAPWSGKEWRRGL